MRRRTADPRQMDWISDTAHARATDPETSHAAARAVTPHLSPLQDTVLRALRIYGPCIDRKLVTVLRMEHGRQESTWRTRRSGLVAKGLVEKIGEVNGHSIWRVKERKDGV